MPTPYSPSWATPLPAAYSPVGHQIGPIDIYPNTPGNAAGYGGVAAGGAVSGALTPGGAPAGPSGGLANYLDSGASNALLIVGGIAAALATAAFFLLGPEIAIAILALGLALDLGIVGVKSLFQAAEGLAAKAGLPGIFGDITLAVVVGGVVYYVSHSRDGRVQIIEGRARHNPPRRRRRTLKRVNPSPGPESSSEDRAKFMRSVLPAHKGFSRKLQAVANSPSDAYALLRGTIGGRKHGPIKRISGRKNERGLFETTVYGI